MHWLLTAFVLLSIPISVIDLDDSLNNGASSQIILYIDDVHPGASSIFTYAFHNTTQSEVDLYLVSIETTNNNALTQNMSLKIHNDVLSVFQLNNQSNLFISSIKQYEVYQVEFEVNINREAGNEVQALSETYQLIFGFVEKGLPLPTTGNHDTFLALPSTAHQSFNYKDFIIMGILFILIGMYKHERGDDDEEGHT